MAADNPVIVALDCDSGPAALALADRLSPELCRVKVGKELFTRAGPELVRQLQGKGFDVFLDLKYHDIPNTVAGAVRTAADLGVWMVNVHAAGGRRMMEAARAALDGGERAPLLVAVTVLTSMSERDMAELGYRGFGPWALAYRKLTHRKSGGRNTVQYQVSHLAKLAAEAGLDGVVCSALEAKRLREQRGDGFALVTPGIRLEGDSTDDQRRVVTPAEALAQGSDYLVIGRSVTGAADPLARLEEVRAMVGRGHKPDAPKSELSQ